jgi:hypothetical protein
MTTPTSSSTSHEEQPITQRELKRERLRFTNFRFSRSPSGQCRADVELEWLEGVRVNGSASGQSSPMGDLRIAAEAALRALESFSAGALQLELLGIKAVRAFDASVVIVSVGVKKGDGPPRLLGSYLAERDSLRGAVIAVLGATNRVLGNFIARK